MILQTCRTMLLNIERMACSAGSSRAAVRVSIARQLGIGPGTLENLFRDRVKTISADLAAKIQASWIDIIEAEIAQLEHERDLALQIHIDLPANELGKVEALLAEARDLLGKKGKR